MKVRSCFDSTRVQANAVPAHHLKTQLVDLQFLVAVYWWSGLFGVDILKFFLWVQENRLSIVPSSRTI